jgi:hypothetical protein
MNKIHLHVIRTSSTIDIPASKDFFEHAASAATDIYRTAQIEIVFDRSADFESMLERYSTTTAHCWIA